MENIVVPNPPHMQSVLEGRNWPEREEHVEVHQNVFVALGLHEQDPGYKLVIDSFDELGSCTALHESLWLVHAKENLNKVFKKINKSMLDRRIGSHSGFLVLNPHEGRTKWYFSQYISRVIDLNWNIRNNFFVAFKLQDPRANFKHLYDDLRTIGTSTPLSRALWYVNSAYSAKEVYQLLIGRLEAGDQLCILDSDGHVVTWEDRRGQITWLPQITPVEMPTRAEIQLHPPVNEQVVRPSEEQIIHPIGGQVIAKAA